MTNQDILFARLRKLIPEGRSLTPFISEALNIHEENARRRINGDTAITYEEYCTLSKYFGIDPHLHDDSRYIIFLRGWVHGNPKQMAEMFQNIVKDMQRLQLTKGIEYQLVSDDLPFFWYFLFPILIKFKIHFWGNALATKDQIAREPFNPAQFKGEFLSQISAIREHWLNFPSSELIGPLPLNSIVSQIKYYREAGLLDGEVVVKEIREALHQVLDYMEECCVKGTKGEGRGGIKLYSSDVPLGNQVVLGNSLRNPLCYISTNDFGYLKTENGNFVKQQQAWVTGMVNKSVHMNTAGEKHRRRWLRSLREKLQELD